MYESNSKLPSYGWGGDHDETETMSAYEREGGRERDRETHRERKTHMHTHAYWRDEGDDFLGSPSIQTNTRVKATQCRHITQSRDH